MKRRSKERGQSLLEMTLALPVLLIILAGLLDIGRLFFIHVAITDAAGEGASYAALHPDDTAGIIARAQEATGGLVTIEEDAIEIYQPVGLVNSIAVAVSYDFSMVTPGANLFLPEGTMTLRSASIELILAGEM